MRISISEKIVLNTQNQETDLQTLLIIPYNLPTLDYYSQMWCYQLYFYSLYSIYSIHLIYLPIYIAYAFPSAYPASIYILHIHTHIAI